MVNQYGLTNVATLEYSRGTFENVSELLKSVFYRDECLLQSILVRQIGL